MTGQLLKKMKGINALQIFLRKICYPIAFYRMFLLSRRKKTEDM